MNENWVTALVSVVLAIIALAALATVLSPKAKTAQVIGAGASGLAMDIGAATSPVTGANIQIGGFGGIGNGIG